MNIICIKATDLFYHTMEPSTCRVCANSEQNTKSIFDEEDEIKYSTKIMQCVNVEINEDDHLPKIICLQCIYELSLAYKFMKKCESSDQILRSKSAQTDLRLSNIDLGQAIKLEIKLESDDYTSGAHQDEFDLKNDNEDTNISKHSLKKHNKTHKNIKARKKSASSYISDYIVCSSDDTDNLSYNTQTKTYKKNCVKHKKNKSGKIPPMQCAICGLLVNSQSAMEIHARTHTGEKPYSCEFCKASYPTKGSVKRHIETFHSERERKFTCETCGSSFFRKNDIVIHLRRHTGEKPYACPYCPNRFVQVASLIRHKRIHTGDKPFSCPICDKKFSDKSMISKHMSVHSTEKNFTCQLCGKAMKTSNSLRAHMLLHTNEKLNVCSFCGTAFSMKGNLKKHIMTVHSEKSGQCSFCMKTFSDLEVHMRKHTGEKPFVCEVCSKAFTNKRSLSCHVQFKHKNGGKFRCSIGECERTFPIGTMLEFHLLKYHTQHTPYICQHCARGFFRGSDLSRHLRVSHAHAPDPPKPPSDA